MLVIGRPDRVLRDAKKLPFNIASFSLKYTFSLVMPLVTLMIDAVPAEASRALLFLRSAAINTLTALAGIPSASDTLPTMACKNDALRTSAELIPSNT